jgi:hypothetical protein
LADAPLNPDGDASGEDASVGDTVAPVDAKGAEDGVSSDDVSDSDGDVASSDVGDPVGDASNEDGVLEDTIPPSSDSSPSTDGDSAEPDVEELPVDVEEPPVDTGGGGSAWLDPCPAVIQISAPAADLFTVTGQTIELEAKLVPVGLPMADWTGHSVQWELESGVVVATSTVEGLGTLGVSSATAAFQDVDTTTLHARLLTPEGICNVSAPVTFHVCGELVDEGFEPAGPPGWVLYGNATYPGNGTVELTGNVTSSGGALYNDAVTVSEGNASMEMAFSTGGGIHTGADGFALTIVNLETVQELVTMLGDAANGGGLGYGVSGAYGPWVGDALHVEVDTWYNFIPDNLHTDPVNANHVSINLNGDPGNDIWHQAIPSIEDLSPHVIRVDVIGSTFKVFYDGQHLVTQQVAGLDFRGGFIFFSASTGWATNFHTIDHLKVIHACN